MPIFCPAFSDSSAGFGLVLHQHKRPKSHVSIDSVKDFRELTEIKIAAPTSGLLMIGGGVPKNFIQDTVICAEILGKDVPMHQYAVQITVADVRDGACSSSTLKEAASWGKVDTVSEQMVFAEATMVLPLLASYAYHKGNWKKRKKWQVCEDLQGLAACAQTSGITEGRREIAGLSLQTLPRSKSGCPISEQSPKSAPFQRYRTPVPFWPTFETARP